jgi:hypothetical protein
LAFIESQLPHVFISLSSPFHLVVHTIPSWLHHSNRNNTHANNPNPTNNNKTQTHSINLPQIPPPRKMRTQTPLRTPRTHPTTSPQYTTHTQYRHPHCFRKSRAEAVENHGRVVEDIGCETVHFAFWFQGKPEPVREEDGGDAAGGFLEDG